MRNPSQRMHMHLGVGRRGTPRPATAEDRGASLGYATGRNFHDRGSPIGKGLPLFFAPRGATLHDAIAETEGVHALCVQSAAVSNATLVHSLQLAQLQVQELLALSRRKDEFLAVLAHELRSPLCAIGYAAGLLRKDVSDSRVQQPLPALIERQVLRMTELVEELLILARSDTGTAEMPLSALDLADELHTSPEVWLNLQMQFDLNRAKKRRNRVS